MHARRGWRAAIALLPPLVACLLGACASQSPPPRPQIRPAPAVHSTEPVIYAVRGEPIVIPLAATGELPPSIEVAFGDDRPGLDYPLFWVQIDRHPIPVTGGAAERAAARWLAWRDRWSIAPPAHARRPGARGFLAVLVGATSGRQSDAIRIAGARYPLIWIPPMGGAALPALSAPDSDLLGAAHRLLRDDPTQRWRADLYRVAHPTPFVGRRDSSRDPLLEALADQTAVRWRFALAQLAEADPELAQRLAAHLGGVLRFPAALSIPKIAADGPPASGVAVGERTGGVWGGVWGRGGGGGGGGGVGGVEGVVCRQEDPIGEEGLLRNLLSERLSPAEKVAAAQVWLAARRRTLVWVVDDASSAEDASVSTSTLAVANLDGAPVAASVAATTAAELTAAPPGTVVQLRHRAPEAASRLEEQVAASLWGVPQDLRTASRPLDLQERTRLARTGESLTVRAAGDGFTRRIHRRPTPATPPGAALGPLVAEWTMSRLVAQGGAAREPTPPGAAQTPTPAEDWLTVGMLYREAGRNESAAALHHGGSPAPRAGEGAWTIYLECGALPPVPPDVAAEIETPDPAKADDDAVRLWFGPFGSPLRVLTIGRDGVVIDETRRFSGEGSEQPALRGVASMPGIGRDVRLVREADRWVLCVTVPDDCIDDGLLRLAIERLDTRGQRTTWPRPVLPWQAEPGRAVIDLSTWGELGM